MSHLLELRDISMRFADGSLGLDRITLTARPGQLTAIVGASGAGKSLLARAVLGLPPSGARIDGEIWLDGTLLDPAAIAGLRGRTLALAPQSLTYLDPMATVGRQLARAARRLGLGRRGFSVDAALAGVGLSPMVAQLYPARISAGMARRVLLLVALAGDPAVVLADEPTDGLDPENLRRVLDKLRGLADAGRTVIVITHDLVTTLPYADQVAVMRDGRIVARERPADFAATGEALTGEWSRRLWNALPQNGFDPGMRDHA